MSPDNDKPQYNTMYETLVGGADEEGDVLGFIAYGLYKKSKREWVSAFRSQFGRSPTEEELHSYRSTWTDNQINTTKAAANDVASEFAEYVVGKAEPQILKKALKGSAWKSIWLSMVANAIYTVVLIIIAVILNKVGIDLLGIFKSVSS